MYCVVSLVGLKPVIKFVYFIVVLVINWIEINVCCSHDDARMMTGISMHNGPHFDFRQAIEC